MKKILLLIALVSFTFMNAQTIVFYDDFDDLDISDWSLVDADGDGNNWMAVQIQDNDGNPVGTPQLRSASWNSTGALTPDNYIVSPVIDLTSASGTIELKWEVKASDADWDIEHYTVYVATSSDVASLLASSTTFDEPTLDGVNELTPRSLDISSFAGESTVYFAFRHHDVTDQFTMEIDNVSVEYTASASINSNILSSSVSIFPNVATDNFTIKNTSNIALTSVSLFDINGRVVSTTNLNNLIGEKSINVSNLSAGMYFVEINSADAKITRKLIKK